MKKLIHIIVLLLFFAGNSAAQSIRKNYNEMTPSERNALVDAFYALRNGPDLIDDLANFHNDNFNSGVSATPIHFNLPGNPHLDVFLAWHRRQIFEVEQAMQDINANLSIPFWDWTTDNSVNSPLWDQNFLGQFDGAWNLGRDLGSGTLPSNTDVNNVQAINNWLNYSDDLERGIVHVGAHIWVALPSWQGGVMAGGASPRDPVFYLHHGMVDKLWQDWEDAHGTSSYVSTSLPRYDGTYVFNGQTLPLVNPNDITDSKALGVFFAENGLAELEDYTVSNTYRNQEVFYYQYTIEAKNNFIVPTGRNCRTESVNEIRLEPGFHAQNGAAFVAKIDTDNNIGTLQKGIPAIVKNTKPFSKINVVENAYVLKSEDFRDMNVAIYPNPFTEAVNFKYSVTHPHTRVQLQIYNITGAEVTTLVQEERMAKGTYYARFNGSGLPEGIYLYRLEIGDTVKTGKIVLKK